MMKIESYDKIMSIIEVLSIVLLASTILLSMVGAQSPELVIRIVDPSGNPLERVEVSITKGDESYRFITNSTGYAVFSKVTEGTYSIVAKLDKVVVARAFIDFPKETSKVVVANISTVKIKLRDLDGKPVPSAQIKLSSRTGITEYSAITNNDGKAEFNRIPYTSLDDIKSYELAVYIDGYRVLYLNDLEIIFPEHELNYSLQLLTLNVTTLNMEGEEVSRANVKLVAGNYTKTLRTDKGVARFTQIPSSIFEWVGQYTINVTYTIGKTEYTVYSSKRMLTSSQSIDLIVGLGRIEVAVLDDEGRPLKNLAVSLSNQRSLDFIQQQTDEDGKVVFSNMPLSRDVSEAGEYMVQVYKLNKKIIESKVDHSSAKTTLTLKVARSSVNIFLRDYNKQPLSGYDVVLIDLDLGDRYNGKTSVDGSILFKILPGKYRIELYKDGRILHRSELNILNESLTLDIESINFPLNIRIVDAFGNDVRIGELVVKLAGETLYSGPIDKLSSLTIPHVGLATIDVKISGRLVWKETILVDRVTEHVVKLSSYVLLLGNIVSLETLGVAASIFSSLIFVILGGYTIYRSRKRRLITK